MSFDALHPTIRSVAARFKKSPRRATYFDAVNYAQHKGDRSWTLRISTIEEAIAKAVACRGTSISEGQQSCLNILTLFFKGTWGSHEVNEPPPTRKISTKV